MVAAVAFASVRSEGVKLHGIEFSAEVKACFDVLGFGALGQKALSEGPAERSAPRGNWVEQHLNFIHAARATIEFPPLSLQAEPTLTGLFDIADGYDCFGVCFYELMRPREYTLAINNGYKSDAAAAAFRRLPHVPQNPHLGNEIALRYRSAMCSEATFNFVEEPNYPFNRGRVFGSASVLKAVSKYKVWAVLLIETSQQGGECNVRLYTNPVTSDKA
jgi:hypothetical protein